MNNATITFLVHLSHRWDGDVLVSTAVLALATAAAVRIRKKLQFHDSPNAGAAAIAARVLAGLTTVSGLMLVLACLHLGCAALVGQETECKNNLKQIGLAVSMYAEDYDERLPPGRNWVEAITPDLKKPVNEQPHSADPFKCPAVDSGPSYARNSTSGGIRLEDIASPVEYPLMFDAETKDSTSPSGARILVGGKELLVENRHSTSNILFCDGHVNWELNLRAIPITWSPKDVPKKLP